MIAHFVPILILIVLFRIDSINVLNIILHPIKFIYLRIVGFVYKKQTATLIYTSTQTFYASI